MSAKVPEGWFPDKVDPAAYDPVRAARGAMKPALPARFYQDVAVQEQDGLHHLLLDGRRARTPARRPLALPTAAAAALLASEWEAQQERIDPATMPVTRITHAALDFVGEALTATRDDIARYAGSDLLVYRASEPQRLVERQAALWDPVLAWADARYGARFIRAEGVRFVEQPAQAIERIRQGLARYDDPVSVAALHVMTTLSGSVLLALVTAEGELSAEEAFAAAELDSDTQREIWGRDEEAELARENRRRDMLAAAALIDALR